MKKILSLLMALCSLTMLASCSDEGNSAEDVLESSSSQPIDDTSKKELEIRDRAVETDGRYVFDDDIILTGPEFDSLNSYSAWFTKTFKINAAVALTEHLGDLSPAEYAEKCYNDNFKGDGILFLINNDTNEDYLYRRGLPSKFISDSDVQMIFADISPMLAMEQYVAASEYILEEAERSLPEYFTDRSGTLSAGLINECDKILKDASENGKLNIYHVHGTGEDKIEDFTKKRFDMFFTEKDDAALLVIDGENGNSYLCASGKRAYLNDRIKEIKAAVKSVYKKNDGVDVKKATQKFVEIASNI